MGCWDFTDEPQPDGSMRRVAFSEPRLSLPTMLAAYVRKAQGYNEHAHYSTPDKRNRHVRVVPLVGAESLVGGMRGGAW